MTVPVPPLEPMLAMSVGDVVPTDPGLAYEPKWDGFRCIVFKEPGGVVVQSRKGDDLSYCFPEIVAAALDQFRESAVLDGELVVAVDGRLDFDALTARIRPRKEAGGPSIADLAHRLPARFIAFDLLATGEASLMDEPYDTRRQRLEELLHGVRPPIHLTPMTRDAAVAARWFEEFESAGLDGIIAKPRQSAYAPGRRTMLKVKHSRTADVVVAGWRPHSKPGPDGEPVVGSLLLGLYDESGVLHHVGVASAFTGATRRTLVDTLSTYALDMDEEHPWTHPASGQRIPGGRSRWTGSRDMSFTAIRPSLVAEVGYDQMQGDRFRHVASFVRWRPDRDASTCGYAQLDRPVGADLDRVLAR